ncbi:MAG: hypothetical protein F4X47_16450 [Gammaproteobacteria bacterium]|nr:hypothetical protein [Gammaproteobacteria bacterium]MYC53898.1 hypothetical protein [Gammaproteobacteria bacterium]
MGLAVQGKEFQAEIRCPGIRSAPAFVGEPEGIYLHVFETLEEPREVMGAFIERYNNGWLLQRHGYMTPARACQQFSPKAA